MHAFNLFNANLHLSQTQFFPNSKFITKIKQLTNIIIILNYISIKIPSPKSSVWVWSYIVSCGEALVLQSVEYLFIAITSRFTRNWSASTSALESSSCLRGPSPQAFIPFRGWVYCLAPGGSADGVEGIFGNAGRMWALPCNQIHLKTALYHICPVVGWMIDSRVQYMGPLDLF